MAKLTQEAKEFIRKNKDLSNRALKDSLLLNFGIVISHAAIGRYKRKYLETLETSRSIQQIETPPKQRKKTIPSTKSLPKAKQIIDFNAFMEKLDKSTSFSAKLLKEKLNVRGRNRKINQDRVIRIIRYTLDIIKE